MITKTFQLEEWKTRELIKKYKQTSDVKIKNEIVKAYLFFVEKIAKNYAQKHKNQYEDLIQVGCVGLLNSIEKFDLDQNTSFKTYCSHLIIGEIKHYLRDQVPIVKLPRDLQELLPKIGKASQDITIRTGKEATDKDIANYLNIPIEKIKETLEMELSTSYISLDQQAFDSKDNNSIALLEQLEDKKYQSFQLSQEDKIILTEAIGLIKDQSKQILEYAFYHDLTQTEIAKKLGISQMQVSRRLKSAVGELWEILNARVTPW